VNCDLCRRDFEDYEKAVAVTDGCIVPCLPDAGLGFIPNDDEYRLIAHPSCWEVFVDAGWKAFREPARCPEGCGHRTSWHGDPAKTQGKRRICSGTVQYQSKGAIFSGPCQCTWIPFLQVVR
jgi:hypothetical protein